MTRMLLVTGLALAVGATACGQGQRKDNVPPKGFKALFNGKNLDGWQGAVSMRERAKLTPGQRKTAQKKRNKKVLPNWTVIDGGVLRYAGKGGSLGTVKDYGNFEMFVDFKIMAKGDSGIYLRGNPQVQIWDPALRKIGSGGLYNNRKNASKPLVMADNPPGQWNTFRIKMIGDRVTIWLNMKLVVDNTPLENYWNRGEPLPATGPIELQHHGNPLFFKNIFIRELP